MQKRQRQKTLLSLIEAGSIANQSELASRLCEVGYRVTQASVSRDLDELGIIKINGFYAIPRKESGQSEYGPVTLDTAGDNLIIGRCSSGLASAITVKIDAAHITEIVGTIAGDDTVFVAVRGAAGQAEVLKKIAEMFG